MMVMLCAHHGKRAFLSVHCPAEDLVLVAVVIRIADSVRSIERDSRAFRIGKDIAAEIRSRALFEFQRLPGKDTVRYSQPLSPLNLKTVP